MQRLINTVTTPPGGFRYVQPETGSTLKAQSWDTLLALVRSHRKVNNLPIGTAFEREVQDQLCQTMPPGVCEFDEPNQSQAQVSLKSITLQQLTQGTATLADWFATSRERVSLEEAERRAAICGKCHFNRPFDGCTNCSTGVLRSIAERIVNGQQVAHAEKLNACQVCGCWLKAAIHLPLEILQRHQPEEQANALPGWCWKKPTE